MSNDRSQIVFIAISLILFLPSASFAHHSTRAFFNPDVKVEIEGVIRAIQWRNPHTVFELDVRNEQGETTRWHVESGALGVLRAQGITSEILSIGDNVKILGDQSMRSRPEMFARNILLASGEEVMLTLGAREYFSTQGDVELLAGAYDEEATEIARRNANGIFRVWSRIGERLRVEPPAFSNSEIDSFPFTAEGRAIRDAWDPGAGFILGCTDWNMPRLMGNPLPMEFIQEGENIVIRFEEGDSRRMIHMNQDADDAPQEHTLMGYSVGQWDGDALVVRTTHIAENTYELPVSPEVELLEIFRPSDDGISLDYEITVSDPVILESPVTQTVTWTWRPEISVNSYACEVEQELN
jgi:hypothetical protein